jgi:hypothetical protein
VGGQRHAPAALPRERSGIHCKGGWVGRSDRVRKISPPPGFDSQTVQPVAGRYTDYAIPPLIPSLLRSIFSTYTRSHTSSATERLYTHIKQQAKLQFYVFQYLPFWKRGFVNAEHLLQDLQVLKKKLLEFIARQDMIWNMSSSAKDQRYEVRVPNAGIHHAVVGIRVSALWKRLNGGVRSGTTRHG